MLSEEVKAIKHLEETLTDLGDLVEKLYSELKEIRRAIIEIKDIQKQRKKHWWER